MLIYAAIGLFGLAFLLVMLFVGELFGGDHDFHAGEAGGHAEAGTEGGPSIFSARIMASFLTAFGAGGVLGRYLDLSHPASSGVGVVAGIVLASVVYQFAHLLYSQQASSEVHMTTLVGHQAEVSVGIPRNGVGQVTLVAGGERTSQIARSADGEPIPPGTPVVVTALGGDAIVVERRARPERAGDRS